MPRTISLVQRVEIASPCTASWAEMAGDDRVRFCAQCKLNVYNLSEMTEEEGERLIIEKEGKLCARIYRRADGTVITRDCPVGLAAIRRRLVGFGVRIAAVLTCIIGATAYAIASERPNKRLPISVQLAVSRNQPSPYKQAVSKLQQWLTVTAPPSRQTMITSGIILVQPRNPPPSRPQPSEELGGARPWPEIEGSSR